MRRKQTQRLARVIQRKREALRADVHVVGPSATLSGQVHPRPTKIRSRDVGNAKLFWCNYHSTSESGRTSNWVAPSTESTTNRLSVPIRITSRPVASRLRPIAPRRRLAPAAGKCCVRSGGPRLTHAVFSMIDKRIPCASLSSHSTTPGWGSSLMYRIIVTLIPSKAYPRAERHAWLPKTRV